MVGDVEVVSHGVERGRECGVTGRARVGRRGRRPSYRRCCHAKRVRGFSTSNFFKIIC